VAAASSLEMKRTNSSSCVMHSSWKLCWRDLSTMIWRRCRGAVVRGGRWGIMVGGSERGSGHGWLAWREPGLLARAGGSLEKGG